MNEILLLAHGKPMDQEKITTSHFEEVHGLDLMYDWSVIERELKVWRYPWPHFHLFVIVLIGSRYPVH